jgi:hypothetical protein
MPRQRKVIPPETLTKIEVHLASGNRILPANWTQEDKKWYAVFKSRKKDDKRKGQRTASVLREKDPELYAQKREANRAACAKYSSTVDPEVRKKRYKDFDEKRKPQRKVYYRENKDKFKAVARNPKNAHSRLITTASDRNIPVDMTKEEVEAKIMLPCFYCGFVPLDGKGNGLDRFDNDGHYSDENTVSCCKHCNYGKHTKTSDEFIDRCEVIAAFCGQLQKGNSTPPLPLSGARISEPKYHNYRCDARKRGLEFSITKPEFLDLINDMCRYCHVVPALGVDRGDNTLGYTSDNCVGCCSACNLVKGRQSFDQFMERCARVAVLHRNRELFQ